MNRDRQGSGKPAYWGFIYKDDSDCRVVNGSFDPMTVRFVKPQTLQEVLKKRHEKVTNRGYQTSILEDFKLPQYASHAELLEFLKALLKETEKILQGVNILEASRSGFVKPRIPYGVKISSKNIGAEAAISLSSLAEAFGLVASITS